MSSLPSLGAKDADEFRDWEVLSSSPTSDDSVIMLGAVDDVRSDCFDPDSKKPGISSSSSSEGSDEGGIDSDNPSSEDRDSDSNHAAERREEDTNSDDESKMMDRGNEGDSMAVMSFGDGGVRKDSSFGGSGGTLEADVMEQYEVREFGSGEIDKSQDECAESDDLGNRGSCGEEEGRGVGWWRMPFQFLKLCVVKLKPVWSIPIAAAIVGLVVLGRRLYRMKHKSRNAPLRIAIDDKRASQFFVHAARLNEALWIVRRAPVIRTFVPAGVSQWPVVSLR